MKIYRNIFIALLFLLILFQEIEVSFLSYYQFFMMFLTVIIFIVTTTKLYKEDKENGTSKLKKAFIRMGVMAIFFITFYFIINYIYRI